MSKKEKLYQRILGLPKDLRYEELDKVLIACGYELDRTNGSHAVYIKLDCNSLTIPRVTPVKSYLIRQVLMEIGEILEDMVLK